jgi:hypothetical protein
MESKSRSQTRMTINHKIQIQHIVANRSFHNYQIRFVPSCCVSSIACSSLIGSPRSCVWLETVNEVCFWKDLCNDPLNLICPVKVTLSRSYEHKRSNREIGETNSSTIRLFSVEMIRLRYIRAPPIDLYTINIINIDGRNIRFPALTLSALKASWV